MAPLLLLDLKDKIILLLNNRLPDVNYNIGKCTDTDFVLSKKRQVKFPVPLPPNIKIPDSKVTMTLTK